MYELLKTGFVTILNGLNELCRIVFSLCAFLGILVLVGTMGQVNIVFEPDGTYLMLCVERCERAQKSGQDAPERPEPVMPTQRA